MTEHDSPEKMRERVNWHADGLTLPCAVCGKDVSFDYNVDDDTWKRLAPSEHRTSVVCLPCLDDYGEGVPLDSLRVVYWTGRNGTVPLIPANEPTTACRNALDEHDSPEKMRERSEQWKQDGFITSAGGGDLIDDYEAAIAAYEATLDDAGRHKGDMCEAHEVINAPNCPICTANTLDEVRAECDRFREALEFYAPLTHELEPSKVTLPDGVTVEEHTVVDLGYVARTALCDKEDEEDNDNDHA